MRPKITILTAVLLVAATAGSLRAQGNPILIDVRENIERGQGHYESTGYLSIRWVPGPWQWQDGSAPSPPVPPQLNPCPKSMVLYIHGFNTTHADGKREANELSNRLATAGYGGPFFWFSWNSATAPHFGQGKDYADLYAPVLAKLLKDIKDECPKIKINIITYSLGARIALAALKQGGCATTVQMIAPAVDNESLQPRGEFRPGAKNAGSIKAWTNDEDDVLGSWFVLSELDSALGSAGGEDPKKQPGNYGQCDVEAKLKKDAKKGGLTRSPVRPTYDVEDDHSAYHYSPTLVSCIAMNLK